MVFVPAVISLFLDNRPRGMQITAVEGFRRFGPIFFLGYCLAILLFSPGEKAFAFSPAEVSFLFPAPFSRRKLLAYKICGNLGLTSLSAIFLTFAFRQNIRIWIVGYLGLVLAFSFLQLFAMAVTLAGQAIGERASTRRRQLALALIAAIIGGMALSAEWEALRHLDLKTFQRLETAPAVRAALAPFRPFVMAISAGRIWPDFASWAAVGLAINAFMFTAILALDAQYLEAAAATSERFYARLERKSKGGPSLAGMGRKRDWKAPLSLPWWGGVGPILWRQITAAGRDTGRVLLVPILSLGIAGCGIFLHYQQARAGDADPAASMIFAGAIVAMGVLISPMLNFDFRGDYEQMEGLKTLPIPASRLALGQLATPTVLLTFSQLVALLVLASGTWPVLPAFWAIGAFALPLNLLLLAIENLMFLWFPAKPVAHTPGDFQAMGRIMLLMMAKLLVLGLASALAAALGFLGYLVGGWIASAALVWLVLILLAIAFLPLIAAAFRGFDVASDVVR